MENEPSINDCVFDFWWKIVQSQEIFPYSLKREVLCMLLFISANSVFTWLLNSLDRNAQKKRKTNNISIFGRIRNQYSGSYLKFNIAKEITDKNVSCRSENVSCRSVLNNFRIESKVSIRFFFLQWCSFFAEHISFYRLHLIHCFLTFSVRLLYALNIYICLNVFGAHILPIITHPSTWTSGLRKRKSCTQRMICIPFLWECAFVYLSVCVLLCEWASEQATEYIVSDVLLFCNFVTCLGSFKFSLENAL